MQTSLLIGSICLLALMMFLILVRILQQQWMKFFEILFQEIQNLNKIAASKDLTTFSTLKTLTTTEKNNPSVAAHPSNIDPYLPMDDASVARRLADHYRNNNIDPSLAYDSTDGLQDDLADLGLIERGGN